MPEGSPAPEDLDGPAVRGVTVAIGFGVVGVGFFVLWLSHAGWKEFGVSLATALIASVLFAALYTTSSERALRRLFRTYLNRATTTIVVDSRAKMQELGAELVREAQHLNRAFRPDKYYPESDEPQPGHNDDLARDLSESRKYYFCGLTGRWVPRRVSRYGGALDELWLVLTLPTVGDDALIGAMNRTSYPKYRELGNAARAAEIRKDIFTTVVAAFTLTRRTQIAIRVAYEPSPTALRAELFDSAVYRSTYLPQDNQKRFPTVYRFPSSTEIYRDTSITFRQQVRTLKNSGRFDDMTTEEDLADHLRGIGFTGGLAELRQMADDYWAKQDDEEQ